MMLGLLLALTSPEGRVARVRVWAAMMGGSLLMSFYPNIWFYLALDIVAAAVIMAPPKTVWQRGIGLCYVGMILLTCGYALGEAPALHIFLSPANSPEMLKAAHDYLGWAAVALFVLWGSDGLFGIIRDRVSPSGNLQASKSGRV